MTTSATIYRHGDLIIAPIAAIPAEALLQESKTVEVGSSDSSHHMVFGGAVHRIPNGANMGVFLQIFEEGGGMAGHSRHPDKALPPGAYVVVKLSVATDEGRMPVVD